MTRHVGFAVSAITAFILAGASVVLADSHVRIVRLSSIDGQVQMDRATGQGLERAILNTPIVEGTRLVTGNDGLAEIEFENESALRIGENSEVKFAQLLMNDAGDKVNQIELIKGIVYLDAASKGDDIYRVTADGTSLLVRRGSEVRLNAAGGHLQVAVFKGDVQLEGQTQPVTVQKKETLIVDPKNPSGYTVAKGTETLPIDAWNKEREAYANTYAQNSGFSGPSRGYGLQDLNYYGDYFYASGYGYVWQPFGFANSMLGWDPYNNGAWMFYPGMGYTWASAYPWGWLPYHYGSWAFINGAGWAWVPGGGYNGRWYNNSFQTIPRVTHAPAGWTAAAPPAIMTATAPRTVIVGKATASPAFVPGGRIPPNFASVVPGRTASATAATHGFASPTARNGAASRNTLAPAEPGFAAAARHGSAAHVFAAPPMRAGAGGFQAMEPVFGGSAGRSVSGTAAPMNGHSGNTAGGASSHSAGGGGAHH